MSSEIGTFIFSANFSKNIQIIFKLHVHIWNQYWKCIKMSTNKSIFDPVVFEIKCAFFTNKIYPLFTETQLAWRAVTVWKLTSNTSQGSKMRSSDGYQVSISNPIHGRHVYLDGLISWWQHISVYKQLHCGAEEDVISRSTALFVGYGHAKNKSLTFLLNLTSSDSWQGTYCWCSYSGKRSYDNGQVIKKVFRCVSSMEEYHQYLF